MWPDYCICFFNLYPITLSPFFAYLTLFYLFQHLLTKCPGVGERESFSPADPGTSKRGHFIPRYCEQDRGSGITQQITDTPTDRHHNADSHRLQIRSQWGTFLQCDFFFNPQYILNSSGKTKGQQVAVIQNVWQHTTTKVCNKSGETGRIYIFSHVHFILKLILERIADRTFWTVAHLIFYTYSY